MEAVSSSEALEDTHQAT